jgi:hypothetical protein
MKMQINKLGWLLLTLVFLNTSAVFAQEIGEDSTVTSTNSPEPEPEPAPVDEDPNAGSGAEFQLLHNLQL